MEDEEINKFRRKCEVGFLYKKCGLQPPLCSAMMHTNILADPPLGGVSKILVSLDMVILNQITPVVKLRG